MVREARLFIFSVLFCLVTMPASAQSPALIGSAKQEGGKLVAYGSLESGTVEAIKKAFQDKTGLTLEYWRASATKVLDRTLSEYRAGRPLFDVVLTNADPMHVMLDAGIFAKYDSPADKNFPPDAVDAKLGPRYRNVVIGLLYNKDLIAPADAPKSLEDLLKPQFRGKVVMPDPTQHTTTAQWLASLKKIMGKEKADKFIRDWAATKPILVESFLPAAKRVEGGQTAIALTYIKYAYIFGKEGAPLDYVRMDNYLGDGHYITLSNKAPHPNAGKAFIDFFLGDTSMKLMAELGEFVNLKGVYPPLAGADKIHFVQMDSFNRQGFAQLKKEYTKIFRP